jgi:hypothetical protein
VLAYHGADVLNIWRPADFEMDVVYCTANVGMRSSTLDIAEPGGIARLDAIALDVSGTLDLNAAAANVVATMAPWALAQERTISLAGPDTQVQISGNIHRNQKPDRERDRSLTTADGDQGERTPRGKCKRLG